VNAIYLQSLLSQGSELNETQVNELTVIGQQCTETGGLAVGMALGLLKDCQKEGMNICNSSPVFEVQANTTVIPINERSQPQTQSLKGTDWLFPNPTSSTFYVKLPSNITGEVTIVDLTGKVQFHQTSTESCTLIEFNNQMASGMYLVRLNTSDGVSLVEKLVIHSK